jgi:hypothetical protein
MSGSNPYFWLWSLAPPLGGIADALKVLEEPFPRYAELAFAVLIGAGHLKILLLPVGGVGVALWVGLLTALIPGHKWFTSFLELCLREMTVARLQLNADVTPAQLLGGDGGGA